MAEAAKTRRTFRVFVSSTFEDLSAERDALQHYVFPRLAEYCATRKARFQAIDLRWGVSHEAGLDQRAVAICLTEIERCQRLKLKPNFIVLLGDRYGWCPLPARIEAGEFHQVLTKVGENDTDLLVWTDKQPANAKGWYRRDDNAVPAEYVLRQRAVDAPKGAIGEQRKAAADAEKEQWRGIEARLRSILLAAVGSLGWSTDDPRMAKYVQSATEQEVVAGALKPDDAEKHVFGFFRSITNLPADDPAAGFRDRTEMSGEVVLDQESQGRLAALKTSLRSRLDGHIFEYEAGWVGSGISTDHIGTLPQTLEACEALRKVSVPHTLCADVWRSISDAIDEQLEQLETREATYREGDAHVDFSRKRGEHFVGREEMLQEISSYLNSSETQSLAIVGKDGSGKSALMAKAFEGAGNAHDDAVTIVRFIGATPASAVGRTFLDSLCHQIAHAYGADESEIPTEFNDLAVEFSKQLAHATAQKPLIVFLDALDQLGETDPARGLSWMPAQLPDNVRLVVSTMAGGCEKTLKAKHPEPRFLSMDKMSRQDGDIALGIWLDKAGRRLQDDQRKEVLDRFAPEGRPLYLRLAFEEARLWHSYTDPADVRKLHAGIPELIKGNLLARLAAPENHGSVMVAHALGYLAASRYGLAEDELIEVLSADQEVLTDFKVRSMHELVTTKLPVVVWSRLYFDLEPYLSEHAADGTTLLAFYHRHLGDSAREQYLVGADGLARHSSLADYFIGKANPKDHEADPKDGGKWAGGSVRGLGEVPFHLAGADRLDDLYTTLTNFHFLEHKAAEVGVMEHKGTDGKVARTYTGVFAFQDDYAIALAKFGGGLASARGVVLAAFNRALRQEGHILRERPEILWQQLYNRLQWSDESVKESLAAELKVRTSAGAVPWLRSRKRNLVSELCIRTLRGHGGGVRCCSYTRDGSRLVSGGMDGTVRVWNVTSGEQLAVLSGHVRSVLDCALVGDGSLAVTVGEDGTVRAWMLDTYVALGVLLQVSRPLLACAAAATGEVFVGGVDGTLYAVSVPEVGKAASAGAVRASAHGGTSISAVAASPDGDVVACGHGDGSVTVWDPHAHQPRITAVLQGHTDIVYSACFTPDGAGLYTGDGTGQLRLWNLATGGVTDQVQAHFGVINDCVVWPDGSRCVSVGDDAKIRVASLNAAHGTTVMKGHFRPVACCAVAPSGLFLATGSDDGTIRIWESNLNDVDSGERLCGHERWAVASSFSADGTRFVSGSRDGDMILWNTETAEAIGLFGTQASLSWCALSPDGGRILSCGQEAAIWEVASARKEARLSWESPVWWCGYSPNGELIASLDKGGKRIWDLTEADPPFVIRAVESEPEPNKSTREIRPDFNFIAVRCAFSPMGSRIASPAPGGVVLVWEVDADRPYVVGRHDGQVSTCAWDPGGQRVASAGEDRVIRLWDIRSQTPCGEIRGHEGWINHLEFLDRDLIVSASTDGTVRVWNTRTGRPLCCYPAPGNAFLSCSSHRGRRWLCATDLSGDVHWLVLEAFPTRGETG